jgi:hypothetical protein
VGVVPLNFCGAIPAWDDGPRVPASLCGLAHPLNPLSFLATFQTFPLQLFGTPIAQAILRRHMEPRAGKEVNLNKAKQVLRTE